MNELWWATEPYFHLSWFSIGANLFNVAALIFTGWSFAWWMLRKRTLRWMIIPSLSLVLSVGSVLAEFSVMYWQGYNYAIDQRARSVNLER